MDFKWNSPLHVDSTANLKSYRLYISINLQLHFSCLTIFIQRNLLVTKLQGFLHLYILLPQMILQWPRRDAESYSIIYISQGKTLNEWTTKVLSLGCTFEKTILYLYGKNFQFFHEKAVLWSYRELKPFFSRISSVKD